MTDQPAAERVPAPDEPIADEHLIRVMDTVHAMAFTQAETIKTVVRTLRQVAQWMPMSLEELQETADSVECLGADTMCCPMCEEVECDDGCPLASVRAEGSPGGYQPVTECTACTASGIPAAADPAPVERPAPVGSWWRAPGGQILQVDGDYLDGPGDQIVTYTEYSPDGTVAHGKWGGAEFAAAYTRIEAADVPDWVEVAW